MDWDEACDDPSLQDLPYKIELNRWGHLEMWRITIRRGECMSQVAFLLQTLLEGRGMASFSCPIETVENIKVADVAWASFERRRANASATSWAPHAPEICLDVFVPGSHRQEFMHRRHLYLEAGAEKFWICNEDGTLEFFGVGESLKQSRICPTFPAKMEPQL